MAEVERQHLDWLARSFGRSDYAPLSDADLEVVLRVGEVVVVAPGLPLFEEGTKPTAAFIVDQGDVETVRGNRVVARAGPGSVHGDLAMLCDRDHLATARAVNAVRAHRLDRTRLLPELAAHPGVLLRWLVSVARRTEQTQLHVLRLMNATVLAQVATLLVEESEDSRDVTMSQATLGTLLGVSRQSVNEALGRLRDQGLVETGYRRISILDRDRVAAIADR